MVVKLEKLRPFEITFHSDMKFNYKKIQNLNIIGTCKNKNNNFHKCGGRIEVNQPESMTAMVGASFRQRERSGW